MSLASDRLQIANSLVDSDDDIYNQWYPSVAERSSQYGIRMNSVINYHKLSPSYGYTSQKHKYCRNSERCQHVNTRKRNHSVKSKRAHAEQWARNAMGN